MSTKLKPMIRVAKRRIEAGEDLEEILDGWTKLTNKEKDEIRKTLKEA